MIKVTNCQKRFDEKKNESKITFFESKEFPMPKSYRELISSISKAFNLKEKGIILKAITIEDDEIFIQDEQDFEENKKEIKEYHIFSQDEEEPSFPTDINIEIEVNLDITDKELENIANSLIKEIPPINDEILNDDISFDFEKYKEEISKECNNIKNDFIKTFESQIDDVILNKRTVLENKVNETILNFSKANLINLEKTNNELKGLKEDSNQNDESIIEMQKAFGEMIYLYPIQEQDKIAVKFNKEDIELEIEEKQSKFLDISDIIIKNVGNQTYKKLYFAKDEVNSSKDICFFENSKNANIHQLTLGEYFTPNSESNHTISLQLNEPKPNKTYDLIIYVREDPRKGNLSKALKIKVKIKEKQEKEDQKEKANLIYKDLTDKYNLSIIGTQEEIMRKIIELKCEKFAIESWIKEKSEEIDNNLYKELEMASVCDINKAKEKFNEFKYDQKAIKNWINEQKAEILYNELNLELKITIDKNEVMNKIIEYNFDEKKIKDWIKPSKPSNPEMLYNKLSNEFEILKKIENKVAMEKIIELNLDEEGMKNWLKEIKRLVDKFDEEFNILTILEEEEFIAEIIRLNLDEDRIREFIEKKLNE